jgi:hypothetical protein
MTVIGIVMPIPGLKKFIIDYINSETLPNAISNSPITFLYRDDTTSILPPAFTVSPKCLTVSLDILFNCE